jgi:hypothetical protein
VPVEILGIAGTTICAGGVVLVVMIIVALGLVWLYRLGWGNTDEDEYFEDYDDEDDNSLVVEIVDDEDT